ncbi:Gfo/Idh/MocA family protein [Marimonas lutisalis]|uniref:Gfo/Idh/MocA family protein n=1 Tax=Marimonas lutisalis TaxID=2545756 RepID=UPI0010F85CCE|nr:Gfo/Idh/MocA family oxidoreductase [Marimonas lutisalis]
MGTQYFVVGSGSIGRRHHDNLTALGAESHLMGWRGLNLATFEALVGGAGQAGVVIATATQVRLELIEICGRLGVPFYVEKPLAFRLDELDRIYAAAEPVAERSVVGFMMRYHPALRALHAGPVAAYGFNMEIGHDVRQWRQNWRFGDSYAARAEGGGVLLDLCHELDMAHCLFPRADLQAVDCIGHADFPGVDFATRVTLAEDGGPVGTVSMDYLSPKSLRRTSLRGRDEVLDLDLLGPHWVRSSGGEDVTREWAFERNDMFLGLMRDFMALAEGRAPSDNPLLPRFDRVYDSCALLARAWEARRFHGALTGGFE